MLRSSNLGKISRRTGSRRSVGMGETKKRRTRLRNLTTPYETARNAASHSAPKTRTPARLNRSDASMSAVVQLPHRIQMTLAAERGTNLTLWKSESVEKMAGSRRISCGRGLKLQTGDTSWSLVEGLRLVLVDLLRDSTAILTGAATNEHPTGGTSDPNSASGSGLRDSPTARRGCWPKPKLPSNAASLGCLSPGQSQRLPPPHPNDRPSRHHSPSRASQENLARTLGSRRESWRDPRKDSFRGPVASNRPA